MVVVFVANIEQMLLVDEGKGHPIDGIGITYDLNTFMHDVNVERISPETHIIKFIKFDTYPVKDDYYTKCWTLKPETDSIVKHNIFFTNIHHFEGCFSLDFSNSNELTEFKKFVAEQQSIAINRIISRERTRDTRFKFNCATVNDRIHLKARLISKLGRNFRGRNYDDNGEFLDFNI